MIRSFTEELLEFINSNFILELHKKIVEEWFLNSDLAKLNKINFIIKKFF